MNPFLISEKALRVAAVAFVILAAAVAVIQNRPGKDAAAVPAPLERGEADPLVNELERCRSVISDDTAGLEACRRIWAENRQRFFVSTKSPQLPAPPAPNSSPVLTKSQDRVPPHEVDQGRAR